MAKYHVKSPDNEHFLTPEISSDMQKLFNEVYLQQKSLELQMLGKARVYIVAAPLFEQLQQAARDSFMEQAKQLQKAFAHLSSNEISELVDKAVKAVREESQPSTA